MDRVPGPPLSLISGHGSLPFGKGFLLDIFIIPFATSSELSSLTQDCKGEAPAISAFF